MCARIPLPSALFACLPKPDHLVWLKSGLGPITTCLRPFWWLICTFDQNGPFSQIFYTPPFGWKGGSSTPSAPFVCPLCTPLSSLEPHFCTLSAHPLCAGTPFLLPFCGGVSAPRIFASRAPNASTGFKFGFLSVHAFFFGPLWPRQGQAFAGPFCAVTPSQGSPCSIHGWDHIMKHVGGEGTAHTCYF